MSVALERMAKQAVLLEKKGDIFSPVAPMRVAQDLDAMIALHRQTWRRRQHELLESGVPTALEGTYGGLLAYPPAATITTTSINGSANLWPNLIYTPIPQNGVLAPQAYRIAIVGKLTTSTSPGNLGLNPLFNTSGTWTTGGSAISGGTTLGASTNVGLTASITNAFYYIYGDLTIRSAGTASSIVAMLHYVGTQNSAAGVAGPAAVSSVHNLLFGGTTITADLVTAPSSFQLAAVHTVATITHNVEQVHFMDWN